MKRIFLSILIFLNFTSSANEIVVSGIKESMNSHISYLVLKEAYEALGFNLVWKPLADDSSLRPANQGQVDGELHRIDGIQKQYTNLIKVPTRINKMQATAVSHDKNLKINGWSSLSKYRVGVRKGILFSERGTKGMKTTVAETNDELFKMVDSKRIDVAVFSRVNVISTKKENKELAVFELRPFIQEYNIYHYLHKKNKSLVFKLNTVLLKMHENGRIDQIRERYIDKITGKHE